jgi:tRNA pseudouridine55 synthase
MPPTRKEPRPPTSAVGSGLILLNKQPGITSFDSLRDIKRALGTGKAGHTGTLDKFAGGLLLVLTGRALKLSRWFTHCDKQYEGTICFGSETETLDPEGAVIANAPPPSREAVEQALAQFRGEIQQVPPAYSAIHIDGERASTLARKGEAPEMQKRPVTIYRLELRSWEPPFAQIFVHCSSGTYIRSLARDIALAAGSRAYLSALIRTRVAGFRLEEAVQMRNEKLEMRNEEKDGDSHSSFLIPHSSFFIPHSIDKSIFEKLGLPCVDVSPENARKIIQGKPLAQILGNTPLPPPGKDTAVAVFSDNAFIAMIESANNTWKYGYVNASN